MFYSNLDGQYVYEGMTFVIDGVTYPPQWLNQATLEQKQAIGLEEVIATNSPASDQFYFVSTELNKATLTYINNPKDLDSIKTSQISQITNTAYSLLLSSDWMVVKSIETSTPMSSEWSNWRASIREVANTTINAITNASDVDAVSNIISQLVWPESPSQ